jgi:hypothetical protein
MSRYGIASTALAAALLAVPALAEEDAATGYFNLPGTETKMKVDGFIQVYGSYFHNQNLYDNGSLIGGKDVDPLNPGATPERQSSISARTTRLGLSTITPSRFLGDVHTRIELDFAKERGFSGTPHFRQAYMSFGGWIVGHTYSNWIDPEGGAETVDFNGPVGQACNDTSFYTQVRYTLPVTENSKLALSLEKNITGQGDDNHGTAFLADGTVSTTSPTAKTDSKYPTVVAAYTYGGHWGHLAIRGLEQHHGVFIPATAGQAQIRAGRWAGAVQLSGKVKLGSRDSLVASCYTGQALGPYGIGIQAVQYNVATNEVSFLRNTGWQAGYGHTWNDRFRSNLVASGIRFRNDNTNPRTIRSAENYFVNTFAKLSKSVELGVEYGYEGLRTCSNAVTLRNGNLSDKNFSNKLQVSLKASF